MADLGPRSIAIPHIKCSVMYSLIKDAGLCDSKIGWFQNRFVAFLSSVYMLKSLFYIDIKEEEIIKLTDRAVTRALIGGVYLYNRVIPD